MHCNLNEGDWVDLGLPSGLLWATRNVGASSPADHGDYYAWAETSPKSHYKWETYQYCDCDTDAYGNLDGNINLTKYCSDPSCGYEGFTDNLTVLQPGDDAATVNYGGRTPTKEEWEELYCNVTMSMVTIDGVYGYCFTGSNGSAFFLPCGRLGRYWSSSLFLLNPKLAWVGWIKPVDDSVSAQVDTYPRYYGLLVRAVRDAK